ncbi:MAG: sialate O-acetylesterase, partial [Alphaproteobacteria bacterium]|nr:sialate O-acetylesterase [Alphaproteobacteria bacterium]
STTGLTISAGTPTLSIVSDTAALTAAGLHQIGNGQVLKIDNTGQAGSCSVDFPGTCGNTNAHCFSVWARETTGLNGDLRRSGSGSNMTAIAGSAYKRYLLENETPSSSSNLLRVRINAGGVIYCLLNQLEEGGFATSEIVTSGAATTRQQDVLTIADLDARSYFNTAQGFISMRYYLDRLIPSTDQYLFVASNGTSAETIGLRVDSTSHALRGYVRNSSANRHTAANGDNQLAGHVHAAGITWKIGESSILSGALSNTQTYSGDPAGLTTLEIGRLSGSSGILWGHVRSLTIGKTHQSLPGLGAKLRNSSDIAAAGGGQSLIIGYFDSQESSGEGGKQQFRQSIGALRPQKAAVFSECGTGASAASKTTQDTNYWWDLATSTRGDAFDTFYMALQNGGLRPNAIIWSQGEQDSHQIGTNTSRAQYKQALEAIFADMRATLGNIPVFIQKIGRRTVFSNTGGVQAIREVQQELIDACDWCHFAAETYDLGLYDAVHPDDAGYLTAGQRLARQLAKYFGESVTGTDGPRITGAVRSGTTVTVTLAHDGGTDFTPASTIAGFHFFGGVTAITINTAVRTNATTITLTLASTPTGTETLYYIYDADLSLNVANVVKDNTAVSMPLRAAKISL